MLLVPGAITLCFALVPYTVAFQRIARVDSNTYLQAVKFDTEAWKKGFTSCSSETCIQLQGTVPIDIEGTYFKNGHAKFEFGKDRVVHPFDGDGMITAFTIREGKIMFRNRFVRTKGYVEETRYKRIMNRGAFGTKKRGLLANLFDINFKNTANTNVIYWDKKLLALQESGLPHYMEADSLHTLGQYTFRGLLKKSADTFTAHPRVEAESQTLIAFSSKKGSPATITIHEFDEALKRTKTRDMLFKGFVFYHDFAVTENFYLFNQVRPPLVFPHR